MLTAVENTFHEARVGRLRPGEAGELLVRLEEVDTALFELRSHALNYLLAEVGLDPETAPNERPDDHTSHDHNREGR